ncbi:formylglycine-generating enzyme family protein [bacterium]|nr:formylglycine-generating enzyme family protein [bacterium]
MLLLVKITITSGTSVNLLKFAVVCLAVVATCGCDQGQPKPSLAPDPTPVAANLENMELPESANSIGMRFKLIPPGTYARGEGSDTHQVTLTNPYELGVHEVTQEQYERVMGTNPSKFKGSTNPVEQVNWEDAAEFCERLSALPGERSAGRVYRLPTEAEWEYACRSGTTTKYSFSDEAGSLGEYAWYISNSNSRTHPVGEKLANSWGLHDMQGNVWEWCSDRYGDYPSDAVTDPIGPQSGSDRVGRGGSWFITAEGCRSANRFRNHPSNRNYGYGFRVTCVPSGQ